MSAQQLPVTDEKGFYEIRFESIGGLGAHLAGQMLAEAGVLRQGLNGAHFSSYGSEKKGTPVKSFIRFCPAGQEVRTASPVQEPHLVAVFHEGLMKTEDVTSGLRSGGTIIVNSARTAAEVRESLKLTGATVGTVDALSIAVEEKTRVNTAMLGAIARVLGFLDAAALRDTIRATFEKRYPHLVDANLRTFERGYAELALDVAEVAPGDRPREFVRPAPLFGYLNAPIGGCVVNPGNTVAKDLSVSRQGFLPAFYREKCVDCAMCEIVCPDFCFVWETVDKAMTGKWRRLTGVDYQYCKGCLKCVEVCPTEALTTYRETEGFTEARGVSRFDSSAAFAGPRRAVRG